jgi:hypothetical protein
MAEKEKNLQATEKPVNKADPMRYIYCGPNITSLLLVYGKIYENIPDLESVKELKLERFFVKIKDYPRKKRELALTAREVSKQLRKMRI